MSKPENLCTHSLYSLSITVKHTYTSFLAISWSRLGRRLILWLIARLRMCLGRVWKTIEFEDFCETAFNMALISAARAWAKVDTGKKRMHQSMTNGKNQRRGHCTLYIHHWIPAEYSQYTSLLEIEANTVYDYWRNFDSLDTLKLTDRIKQIFTHELIWKLWYNQHVLFGLSTSLLN